MRLSLDSDTNTWQLSELEEAHIAMLREAAADIAYSQTEQGRKRLFPRPLTEDETFLEEEFLTDWTEFVSDELKERFGSDVKSFLDDLNTAILEETENEEGEKVKLYKIILPLSHGVLWFSTLNQARLMMDQKWKLHNENDQFVPFLTPTVLGDLDPQERFAVWLRYDVYCMIQEWLVRQIM